MRRPLRRLGSPTLFFRSHGTTLKVKGKLKLAFFLYHTEINMGIMSDDGEIRIKFR